MPSLGGATGWLNSEPLGPAELQGVVVGGFRERGTQSPHLRNERGPARMAPVLPLPPLRHLTRAMGPPQKDRFSSGGPTPTPRRFEATRCEVWGLCVVLAGEFRGLGPTLEPPLLERSPGRRDRTGSSESPPRPSPRPSRRGTRRSDRGRRASPCTRVASASPPPWLRRHSRRGRRLQLLAVKLQLQEAPGCEAESVKVLDPNGIGFKSAPSGFTMMKLASRGPGWGSAWPAHVCV